jgi:hypothetical protein
VTISGISVTPVTASGGSLCDAALSLDVHMACLDGDQFPPSFASLPNIATLLGLYSSQASIASSSNSSATPTGRRRLSSSFNELDDEAAYDMLEADGYGNYDRAPLQVMASSSSDNNYEAATMQLVGTSKQRALLQASGSCICPTLNTTTLQAAQAAAAASTTDINSESTILVVLTGAWPCTCLLLLLLLKLLALLHCYSLSRTVQLERHLLAYVMQSWF